MKRRRYVLIPVLALSMEFYPGYDLLVHDDRLLFFGYPGGVWTGPASIAAYPTWPADIVP